MLSSLESAISGINLLEADIPYTWTDRSKERDLKDNEKWKEVMKMEFPEIGDFPDSQCLNVLKVNAEEMRVEEDVLEQLFENPGASSNKQVIVTYLTIL